MAGDKIDELNVLEWMDLKSLIEEFLISCS